MGGGGWRGKVLWCDFVIGILLVLWWLNVGCGLYIFCVSFSLTRIVVANIAYLSFVIHKFLNVVYWLPLCLSSSSVFGTVINMGTVTAFSFLNTS